MSVFVKKLRAANTWLNEGECCGQVDASGTCMAPACIFGEALKIAHEAADEITTLRAEVERLTAVALAAEKESTYEHFEAHIDRMGDENATLRAANERLRAALEWFADAYNKAGFIAAAYVHKPECRCLRCAHDNARAALAQEKQDD